MLWILNAALSKPLGRTRMLLTLTLERHCGTGSVLTASEKPQRIKPVAYNAALSGSGPKECQETPWPVPAVRLNA
jgi:hypothetical protein